MTGHEKYILTPKEEEAAIDHAIRQAKSHFEWQRVNEYSEPLDRVLLKIATIDWNTKIDRAEVLDRVNKNKHSEIWNNQCRKIEKRQHEKKIKELKSQWTSKYYYSYIKYVAKEIYKKDLIYNDQTEHLIKTWCYFMGEDPRFETELGYDFKKGLLLRGVSGLGKTFIAECLQRNEFKPVSIHSMVRVEEEVKEYGVYVPTFSNILYLDDVGTEEPVINHYGTKVRWFKNFFELYYANKLPFDKLIISTNNSFDQIERSYGFRVRDRIKDVFNIVDLHGESFRGK